MLLEPREISPSEDLVATMLSVQSSPTPVDDRRRPPPVADSLPEVGTILLNRWRLVAWAGVGTANVVFRGEHVDLSFPVAIKVVNRQHPIHRATVIGHLRNEARILARLRHPNLARLWDFHEEGEYPCLVTDFLDGTTLRQLIQLVGRIDPRRAVRAAIHMADALAAVWRDGVIHRDVKPDNIILCVDGSARLIDFGLAIRAGEENPGAHAESSTPRVGTVAYLSPEQARNSAAVDLRADIYSLGATLYHAVTGRLPFGGKNAAQVILRHIEDTPIPPRSIVPDLHESLSDAILRMMAKNPKDRFANARDLSAALLDVQESLVR